MVSIKHFLPLFVVLLYSPSSYGFYNEDSLSKNPNKTFDENLAQGCALNRVNVDDYGAKGDGTDDSEAFKKAWDKACSSEASAFEVPQNKVYHLKPITFSGPCHSGFTMKIYGTIKASTHQSDYEQDRRRWLVFEKLQAFTVEGGGTINGNGKVWWENSCKINKNKPCKGAPTAVTFKDCNNLMVNNIRLKNAQQMHMIFEDCQNVKASNLLVVAPEKSPNTDGIHVTGTQNIHISSSVVRTGDDCVSIVSGSKNVLVTDLKCGPGHGISIGSLGKDKSEAHVSDVTVNRALLRNTTNGVRIKTWQYKAVQVKDVLYNNIRGTSESEVAIKLDCSKTFPCQGIELQNVIIGREGGDGDAKASCTNVRLETIGKIYPSCKNIAN